MATATAMRTLRAIVMRRTGDRSESLPLLKKLDSQALRHGEFVNGDRSLFHSDDAQIFLSQCGIRSSACSSSQQSRVMLPLPETSLRTLAILQQQALLGQCLSELHVLEVV